MPSDFPRILGLLRKEKGVSQKQASADLEISQAVLSHYEKGIRECGLDFLVRCADYYGVSCDYLLGRSPNRTGEQISVEELPEPDTAGKENNSAGSVMPVLYKKLIANSMNVLFELLSRSKSRALLSEVSTYLMLAVYKAFRLVYRSNAKNLENMFTVKTSVYSGYADAAMSICETNAQALALGDDIENLKGVKNRDTLLMTTEMITEEFPLFSSSLLTLIQNSEMRITNSEKTKN